MSCSYQEAIVAWCHGEGDDAAALGHLAGCATCQAIVTETEAVWAAGVAGRHAPRVVRSHRGMWWAAGLAAAAAAALFAGWSPSDEPRALPSLEPVDEALVDLELAIDELDSEISEL